MSKEQWVQQGRDEKFTEIISKFEDLHQEYIRQGDSESADLLTDLVAWLQDDLDGMRDVGNK
jgi:hypothetical protein